jgi:hypothetical protein
MVKVICISLMMVPGPYTQRKLEYLRMIENVYLRDYSKKIPKQHILTSYTQVSEFLSWMNISSF